MKVIIIGGGLAGLTAAHELVDKGFTVEIYEMKPILGGMTASRRENSGIPSEHSWRGYAPRYLNFQNIAKKIPTNRGTVFDNLSRKIIFHRYGDKAISTKNLSVYDIAKLGYFTIKYATSDKRKDEYYQRKLLEFTKDLSHDGKQYIEEYLVGPSYGMQPKDISVGHFFNATSNGLFGPVFDKPNGWYEMNQPSNEAWIDWWEKYLIGKGVRIFKNHTLQYINVQSNRVINMKINGRTVEGDYYVLAIDPFAAEKLVKNLPNLYSQHLINNKGSSQDQIAFRLGFNKKLKYPSYNPAFAILDSEFNITFYAQEEYWPEVKLPIESLWSGTCVIAYREGKLFGKKAIDLTKEELMEEILYQIFRNKKFQEEMYRFNGFYLSKSDVSYKEIWFEWKEKGKLTPDSKKWGNTYLNQSTRLKQKTEYRNLVLAGAHTDTSMVIYSMERAIESGKLAANLILKSLNKQPCFIYTHRDSIKFRWLQPIDNLFYRLGLPHVIDIFLVALILIIIVKMFIY